MASSDQRYSYRKKPAAAALAKAGARALLLVEVAMIFALVLEFIGTNAHVTVLGYVLPVLVGGLAGFGSLSLARVVRSTDAHRADLRARENARRTHVGREPGR